MSNSNSNIIAYLNAAVVLSNQIAGFFHIILGTFGNCFKTIIFTCPTLRNNPCVFYFLVGSIFSIMNVYTSVLSRFLAIGWNIDATATNSFLCRLRSFSLYPTSALVLWFVVFASVDRFLSTSSSAKFRQLSNLSLAKKISIFVILITYLAHIHIFFFFYASPQKGCTPVSDGYGVFFICQYVIFYNIIPIILMTMFGILMIRNVRQVRNRVIPQANNEQNQRLHSNNRQLFRMLLLQIMVCTLISMPFAVMNVYNTIYTNILGLTRSAYDQAFYLFWYNILRVIFTSTSDVGFFIYTLASPKFRAEFIRFNQYGLKVILTVTRLMQYLPARIQQRLQGENNLGIGDASIIVSKRTNIIRHNQQPPVIKTDV